MLKKILWIVDILAFISSLIWFINKPYWDSLVSVFITSAGLIALFFVKTSKDNKKINMSQDAGENSTQYQANGDITINNH